MAFILSSIVKPSKCGIWYFSLNNNIHRSKNSDIWHGESWSFDYDSSELR